MRVLFVGLGGVGQRHLRNLRALVPDVEFGAWRQRGRRFEISNTLVVDSGIDIVDKYAIHEFTGLEAALNFVPSAAVVANPSALHYGTCRALIEAGIPVLLEKPMAVASGEALALAAQTLRCGVTVQVGYQLRFHPCVRAVRQWLADGRLGRLHAAEVRVHSYMPAWHGYEPVNELYAARRDLGGGVVLTESHEIDLLAWFFGGPPRRLWASGGTLSSLALDVEDTIGATLEQPDGQGGCFPVSLSLSFIQQPPSRRFAVYGERGRIDLDVLAGRATLEEIGGLVSTVEVPNFDRNMMFLDEMREFLACVREAREPDASPRRCLAGELTMQAIHRSLAEGGVVEPLATPVA